MGSIPKYCPSFNYIRMKPVIFKSVSGNTYLYSSNKGVIMPIEPSTAREVEKGNGESPLYMYLLDKGYLKENTCSFTDCIAGDNICDAISNLTQVVFEVTTSCNMRCQYCCYGDGYTTFQKRTHGNLSFEKAKVMLDYIAVALRSTANRSTDTKFAISFYGGEPLLNIELIKQIVEYAKTLNFKGRRLCFSMTTNAVHLANNMNFLKENDFHILVSLDGARKHNRYRIYPNLQETFDDVISNLKKVQKKYPDWFKTLRFNSVYTNLSDVKEIVGFFRSTFNKVPTFSPLHPTTLGAPGSKTINGMLKRFVIPEYMEEDMDLISKNPRVKLIYDLILRSSFNFFVTENEILNMDDESSILPTGTCIPFSKRLFVDHNGGIHPCEKVCRDEPLGYVDAHVCLPFEKIANDHNKLLQKMRSLCEKCYKQKICTRCLKERGTKCDEYCDINRFKNILSEAISYVERHPNIINDIEKYLVIR